MFTGWVRTEIGSGHLLQYPFYLWLLMTGKSPRQGAQTTLHCCLTDEKVSIHKHFMKVTKKYFSPISTSGQRKVLFELLRGIRTLNYAIRQGRSSGESRLRKDKEATGNARPGYVIRLGTFLLILNGNGKFVP